MSSDDTDQLYHQTYMMMYMAMCNNSTSLLGEVPGTKEDSRPVKQDKSVVARISCKLAYVCGYFSLINYNYKYK